MNETIKTSGLRLIVLIADVPTAKKAEALLQKAGMRMRYRIRAEGTVSNELLDYLGLGNRDRRVIFVVAPKQLAPILLNRLNMELQMENPGNGVAFTVRVSGVSNVVAKIMDKQAIEGIRTRLEREVQDMEENIEYSLVLAIVNEGYSELVMESAKKAGARGGTVIRAHRLGMEETAQFWGICLQNERDVVAIVVPKQEKNAVMKAINEGFTKECAANQMVIALPLDDVVGLS